MRIILLLLALIAFCPYQAWTAAQVDRVATRSTKNGGHLIVPVNVSGDTNSVVISVSSTDSYRGLLEGLLLWSIKVTPGEDDEVPDSTIDVTISCDGWTLVWSGASNTAVTTKSVYEANAPPVSSPMITGDVTVGVSNLGSGNTATIDLIFW